MSVDAVPLTEDEIVDLSEEFQRLSVQKQGSLFHRVLWKLATSRNFRTVDVNMNPMIIGNNDDASQ